MFISHKNNKRSEPLIAAFIKPQHLLKNMELVLLD